MLKIIEMIAFFYYVLKIFKIGDAFHMTASTEKSMYFSLCVIVGQSMI